MHLVLRTFVVGSFRFVWGRTHQKPASGDDHYQWAVRAGLQPIAEARRENARRGRMHSIGGDDGVGMNDVAGSRHGVAAIQVLPQRLEQLRRGPEWPLIARPSDQIRRLDPAKSIGKFHLAR